MQIDAASEKIQELIELNYKLEKNQAIYIAKKLDPIDKKLAKFVNK